MALNRDKALKQAEKLVAKGKDRDAITVYQQVVENDPRDMNSVNKIGDLFLKLGNKAEALEQFGKVAAKYAEDGFTLRAIAMYKKCTRTDPSRIDFHEQLADLNAQQGLVNEARAHYETVAERHLQEGKADKAREVFAKIAELEPDNLKTRLRLADLYLKDNQINLALGEYQVIGSELAKKGMLDESLQVLDKALGLDPSNVEILRAIARTHAEMGQAEKGIEFIRGKLSERGGSDPDLLVVLGETYQAGGQHDAARQALDQALSAAPDRIDVRSALFRLHLAQGDVDGALAHHQAMSDALLAQDKAHEVVENLKSMLKVKDGHVGVLEQLLEVHGKSGADEKVRADVMSTLSEAYIAEGRYPDAERVLVQLVELEPDAAQHQEKLEFVRVKQRGSAPEIEAAEPDMSFGGLADEEEQSFGLSFDDGELDAQGAGEADDRTDFVNEHLAEADVFIKYGLVDKAIEQLETILGKYPDDLPTRQKLKDLLVEEGRSDQAIEQCLAMARTLAAAGDSAGEYEALAQAKEIDPNHPALAEGAAAAPAEAAPVEDGGAGGFELQLDAPQVEDSAAGGFEIATEEPVPAPAAATGSSADFEISLDEPAAPAQETPEAAGAPHGGPELEISLDAGGPGAPAADFEISLDEPAEEAGGEVEVSLDEPAPAPAAGEVEVSLEEEPAPASTGDELEVSLDETPEPAGESGDELELSLDEPAPAAAAEAAAAPPAPAEVSPPAAEAPAAPAEAPAPPAPAGISPPAAEAPAAPAEAPAPPAEPAAAAPAQEEEGLFGEEDDFFNFADELSKELEGEASEEMTEVSRSGNQAMSLEEIVAGMQKGVAEQVDAEDYETHYNLGIAYKEMGLVDEAIGEFQYSSKDPSRFLQCCILLGACFSEKGMPQLAVKWYEKGLTAPDITDEDRLALTYEIAACKEADGDDATALDNYMDIYASNARYRDVSTKVQQLKAKLGA